jgi:hypothetical protein
MASEKIFYKYQSLKVAVNDKGKVLKDNNGNNIIYSIKNLANNQLYFNDPTKFNDPFDCKFNVVQIATREQWIIFYMSGGVNELLATMYFTFNVTNKILIETEDNLYLYDYIKDIKFKIKQGYLPRRRRSCW